jgi:hypothetical protein
MIEKYSVPEIKIQSRADVNLSSRHLTLAKVLQGVELTDTERRAMIAADALQNSFAVRRTLFAASIFFSAPSGIFRVNEVLGFTPDETVAARDLVKTKPGYATLWQRHQTLMEPNVAEVAIYKRGKKNHAEIAEILGIDKNVVDKISLRLARMGIIKPRTPQAKEFTLFCKEVALADGKSEGGTSTLISSELAAKMGNDLQRVNRARVRNRLQARPSSPGNVAFAEIATAMRAAVLAHPERNDQEIADSLAALNVTKRQIMWQRRQLILASLVQRKMSVSSPENGIQGKPSIAEEVKMRLHTILDGVSAAGGTTVVIAELYRDYPSLQTVSVSKLRKLYLELAEVFDVPEYKRGSKTS